MRHPDGSAHLVMRSEQVNVNEVGPNDNGAFTLLARYVGTVTGLETGQRYHLLVIGHIVANVGGQVYFIGTGIRLTPVQ